MDFLCFCMKVPFEEVPDLVSSRKVFLHKGYAYVAMNQVIVDFFHWYFQ